MLAFHLLYLYDSNFIAVDIYLRSYSGFKKKFIHLRKGGECQASAKL